MGIGSLQVESRFNDGTSQVNQLYPKAGVEPRLQSLSSRLVLRADVLKLDLYHPYRLHDSSVSVSVQSDRLRPWRGTVSL